MAITIDYTSLGKFTLNNQCGATHHCAQHYAHPQNVEEDQETGKCSVPKTFAKRILKIIALPALYFERFSKIVMTYLICPYQFLTSEKDFYKDKKEKIEHITDGKVEFKDYVLKPEGDGGPELDAIEVIPEAQQQLDPSEQKWVFFALPNVATHQTYNGYLFLSILSRMTGLCFACTNYRGARKEPFHRPEKFQDIVTDVDMLVKHKFKQGVKAKNSMMQGFSLGGNVALHVAARHQEVGNEMSYFGENTFNRLHKTASGYATGEAMVRFVERHLSDYIQAPTEGVESIQGRALHALREIVSFTPHIIIRTIFFAALFFEHMYFAELNRALNAIGEMIKTLIFDPIILITSIVTLLAAPFADLTYAISYLGKQLVEDFRDHLLFVIARSRMFTTVTEKFIIAQGWKTEGVKEWSKIRGEKFATAVKTDTVVHWESSLVNGIMNEYGPNSKEIDRTYVHKNTRAEHKTFVVQEDPGIYFRHLEKAFNITFPDEIHKITGEQMSYLIDTGIN